MSVGWFRVEVSFQVSVTKFDHNIKEGKGFLRFFSSEVDGLMSGITIYTIHTIHTIYTILHNSSVVEHTATSHTFSSHSSGQQFTIKHHLHCLSTNVVYLINCKKCGFQYIGETKRTLKTRLLEHCGDTKHKRDKPVARHFNQPNHTAEDILIMAIDRPSKNDTYHRLALESKWIEKLKTFHPFGINVKGHH